MKAKAALHHGQGFPSTAKVQLGAACRAWHCRRPSRGKSRVDDPSEYDSKLVELLLRLWSVAFFLAPVLFIVGLLWCSGTISAMTSQPPALDPGYVYRSKEVFDLLLPDIISDNSAVKLNTIWTSRRKLKQKMPCNKSTANYSGPYADLRSSGQIGYLIVDANGGLNQQRSSICNAVAVAVILNAILVIPQFHLHNVWMDISEFGDIYDEDHFVDTLKGHVTVVRELPEMVMNRFDNISSIPNLKVDAWSPVSYYLNVVAPILQEQGVIRISPFANRLAVEATSDIQMFRCLCNYKALKFSAPIETMAEKLVDRMVEKSSKSGGKYVAVHLRFEEDMVAFSCCVYDGGLKEKAEMDSARRRAWKKFALKGRCSRPDHIRMHGRCPLTPLEVGMMLRGMGFNNSTALYLASGKIYNAEKSLEPLVQLFPLLQTKSSLATPEELAPFQSYSSRLAALDYTVSLHSEVFVTTQGGNFPHFMMGHRRFLYGGHAKTVQPDKKKLAALLHDTDISWRDFRGSMETMLYESNRKGIMMRKSKQSVYTYPWPDCMCLQDQANSIASSTTHLQQQQQQHQHHEAG